MSDSLDGTTTEAATTAAVDSSKEATAAAPKLFTQEEVNEIAAKRAGRVKASAVEEAAEIKAAEKASEALSQVEAIRKELDQAKLEAQLLRLAQKGADAELLASTGLRGEALDTFAEKLLAVIPPSPRLSGESAKSTVAIEAIINNRVSSAMAPAGDWKNAAIEEMSRSINK